ncbi:MAG: hypothetical protein HZA79_14480 [Sphingobacteriales bacterium]|nr:hypothetical protein [Sphingobacteriales bacterium]
MKLKAFIILGLILVSLLPVSGVYKFLQTVLRPRASMRRFLFFLLVMFGFIFAYTFLLVLCIKMIFPGA